MNTHAVMQRARDTYDLERSPSSRKKQRLSSPTYDLQYDLSQDQLQAFDELDQALTQRKRRSLSPRPSAPPSQAITPRSRRRRTIAIAMALKENVQDDVAGKAHAAPSPTVGSNPAPKAAGFQSAASLAELPRSKYSGFGSALHIAPENTSTLDPPSSSPDPPPEPDLAAWFASSDVPTGLAGFSSAKAVVEHQNEDWFTAPAPAGALGFKSAKSIHAPGDTEVTESNDTISDEENHNEEVPAFTGFTIGSSLLNPGKAKKSTLMPSAEALAKAARTMELWNKEFEDEDNEPSIPDGLKVDTGTLFGGFTSATGTVRPILGAVDNSSDRQPPSTPTPAGGSGFKSFSPLMLRGPSDKTKAFKSPLMSTPATKATQASSSYVGSQLNPKRLPESKAFVAPTRVAGPSTPIRPVKPTSPPKKILGVTPRHAVEGGGIPRKSLFSTPFKKGMKPGEPGRMTLTPSQVTTPAVRIVNGHSVSGTPGAGPSALPSHKGKGKGRAYFDLSKPSERKSLATCGLRPQAFDEQELEAMGVNVAELNQITPDTALYYSFHTFAPSPVDYEPSAPPPTAALLGVTAALNELHNGGCSLATKSWVENHWGLILWKLAGMVCLDPKSESDPRRKRWCWGEVMRQLRYRYERELNRASRPPLRLIAAQDSPAGGPIVLCISSVTWIPAGDDEHGIPNEPNPVVEVTDGWYRMHAEVDEPLVRALRRGTLSVGKKVAVIGARLSSEKKDGAEILEGGGSLSLRISGNSSHLAPWHAKLGFQKDPFISMLGSLTSDGGTVAVCDVVIEKAYPIAYFEFIETPDGGRKREGPRNENEEAAAHDQWMAKRDATASKLRSDVDAKLHALEGYAERLERKAGSGFRPGPDASAPDHIDDLLFELEEGPSANDVLKRVTATEAGWLARAIRDKIRKERECQGEDVSKELNDLCPPREVRSFRVLVVRDATTRRRPSERSAQITVWDVLSAFVSEDGKAGLFKEGQRFVVTNLIPTQHSAWMPRGPDSVIYLATRRDSRWRRHK